MPQANKIVESIKNCKEQIKYWTDAERLLPKIEIRSNGGWDMNASSKYVPFSVIRVISIDGFTKELADLEKQLEAL